MRVALWDDSSRKLIAVFEHRSEAMATIIAKESLNITYAHTGPVWFTEIDDHIDAVLPDGRIFTIRQYNQDTEKVHRHPVMLSV